MLNQVVLVGRLTRDPELKKTQKNQSVTNITVACETGFDDKKQTDYINCVVWNKQADFVVNYLKKGSLVAVQGKIQLRSWEDSNGKKQYVQEVLVGIIKSLEKKSVNDGQTTNQANRQHAPSQPSYDSDDYITMDDDYSILDINSDDLPF